MLIMFFIKYADDSDRIFGQHELRPDQPPQPEVPEEPQENNDDLFPPEVDEDRELNLDESEAEDVDEIINDANNPESDDENEQASQSFSILNRPRRGNAFYNQNGFMSGKFIILESKHVNPDDKERIYECCLCQVRYHICLTFFSLLSFKGEANFNDSFNLSYSLEKELFSNGLFRQKGDGLSICFQKHGITNGWQLICSSCAYEENETVKLYDEVYRIRFHIR